MIRVALVVVFLGGCVIRSGPTPNWPCELDTDCMVNYCCHPELEICINRPPQCPGTCDVCTRPACTGGSSGSGGACGSKQP